jgi:hypothetical protein
MHPVHFWWVTAVVNLKRQESVSDLPHQRIPAQCLGAHVIGSVLDAGRRNPWDDLGKFKAIGYYPFPWQSTDPAEK